VCSVFFLFPLPSRPKCCLLTVPNSAGVVRILGAEMGCTRASKPEPGGERGCKDQAESTVLFRALMSALHAIISGVFKGVKGRRGETSGRGLGMKPVSRDENSDRQGTRQAPSKQRQKGADEESLEVEAEPVRGKSEVQELSRLVGWVAFCVAGQMVRGPVHPAHKCLVPRSPPSVARAVAHDSTGGGPAQAAQIQNPWHPRRRNSSA
jgi:hypothetical protein